MGSYFGAEVCKLVGIFTLSKLGNFSDKKNTSLYHDNGLVALRNINAHETDKMGKVIMNMFKKLEFNSK